jgi:hypothetical protein
VADETELAPEEELETEVAPVEEAEVETQPDPIEGLASKLGWVPKDQFRGNPDDWKPAEDFIVAGKDIQRNLSRDVRELRGTVENMSRTSATLLEQQLARQKAELEARFNAAVEEGDPEAARTISTQIDQLATTAPAAKGPTPAGVAFAEKHSSWFNKDPEATRYAAARAQHYADQGLSDARQLQAVEKDMREIFPDLFPAPTKAPATVTAPGSRAAGNSGRKKGFHDLPAEAQKVARDMADRGLIKIDDYVTNYFAQPERKVG